MKQRLGGIVVAAALMLGVLAPAAMAQPDAGFFGIPVAGTAAVGESFTVPCTKAGTGVPTGRGLVFPELKDIKLSDPGGALSNAKDRVYRLDIPVSSLLLGTGVTTGTLNVCGRVTKAFGIARCGMSKGYNGKGIIEFDTIGRTVKLSNITWKISIGGTLPITGRAHDITSGSKSKPSRLISITQAIGGIDCGPAGGWSPTNQDRNKPGQTGSTGFTVRGVYVIDQSNATREWKEITNRYEPKNDGKSTLLNPWGTKKHKKPPKEPHPGCAGPLPCGKKP